MNSTGANPTPLSTGRRAFLAGIATGLAGTVAGCSVPPWKQDADGDGVPDDEDAAPRDDRVAERFGGDPPPALAFEHLPDRDAVRIGHRGGDAFTPGNTRRLEVAVRGDPVATAPLPFATGDEFVVEDPPTGRTLRVIWFGHADERRVVDAFEVPADAGQGDR